MVFCQSGHKAGLRASKQKRHKSIFLFIIGIHSIAASRQQLFIESFQENHIRLGIPLNPITYKTSGGRRILADSLFSSNPDYILQAVIIECIYKIMAKRVRIIFMILIRDNIVSVIPAKSVPGSQPKKSRIILCDGVNRFMR